MGSVLLVWELPTLPRAFVTLHGVSNYISVLSGKEEEKNFFQGGCVYFQQTGRAVLAGMTALGQSLQGLSCVSLHLCCLQDDDPQWGDLTSSPLRFLEHCRAPV